MTSLVTNVDLRSVEEGLLKLKKAGFSIASVMRDFRREARADQLEHGKKRQESSGSKWAPRATSTVQGRGAKRARMRKRRPLGRLSSAIDVKASARGMVVTSRVKWSGVHQDGGVAGHGARIPKREFLWWSPSLLAEVAHAIVLAAKEDW